MRSLNVRPVLAAVVATLLPGIRAAPFKGTPFVPPCLIEAEDFDMGGEGVGYHVEATSVAPNPYRPDAVSITGATNRYIVNLEAAEWISFSLEVPEAAAYDVEFLGLYGLGQFVFALDLVNAAGMQRLATWGGGASLPTEPPVRRYFISRGVSLPTGPAQLRLVLTTADWGLFRQGAGADWIRISRPAPMASWTPLAGDDVAGFTDGAGTSARFDRIAGMATDDQSNVYIADAGNRRIRKVGPDGTVRTLAGSGATGSQDGPPGQASFSELLDLGADGSGNVVVLDGTRLRKVDAAGIVSALATVQIPTGDRSYLSNIVEHTAEEHYRVSRLAVDRAGRVYVLGSAVSSDQECWMGPFGSLKCNWARRTQTALFTLTETLQWTALISRELHFTDYYMGVPGECGSSLFDLGPASEASVISLQEHHCQYAMPSPPPTSGWALLACTGVNQTNTLQQDFGTDGWTSMPARARAVGDGSFVCLGGSDGNLMWLRPGQPMQALPGTWPTNAMLAIGSRQEVYLATSTRIYRYAWPEGPLFAFLQARVLGDRLLLQATGPPDYPLRLEASEDFQTWTTVEDFTIPRETITIEAPVAAPQRFFRVAKGP